MRQWLEAIYNAPKAEFEWFLGVLWDNVVYIAALILIFRWLWRLASTSSKKEKG